MKKEIKYKKFHFPGGLRLVNISGISTNAVTISAYIKAGFKYDYKSKIGISHFTEHIAFNSTKSFPSSQEVAQAIEGNGGWHNAFTWIEAQEHTVHIPVSSFEIGAKLIAESVFDPIISEKEVKKERGVIREEILRNKADSEKAVWDYAWFPLFFENTSLARPYSGTEEDINNITKKDLKKFIDDYFTPQNTVMFVAGDLDDKYVYKTFEKLIKDYNSNVNKILKLNKIIPKNTKSVYIHKSDYIQTSLMIGVKTVSFKSDQKYIFDLMKIMLAGYYGAPLIQKLRDEGGLIYSWSVFHHAIDEIGYLAINLTTSEKNTKKLVKIIYDELRRFETGKISNNEFNIAKKYLSGSLMANMETGRDYIEWYSLQELLNPSNIISPEEAIKLYNEIKIDNVKKVAKDYFKKNKILVSGVGNFDESNIKNLASS